MKKNVTIDRLRGFCVLAVVCLHTLFFLPNVLTLVSRTHVDRFYFAADMQVRSNLGLTLIAAGTAVVLFANQCVPFVDTRPSSYDPFAYLGRMSYEMYLFHMTIFALLNTVMVAKYPELTVGVAMRCLVTVSDFIRRFYAEPLNRLLRTLLLPVRGPRGAATPGLAAVGGTP